VDLATFLRGLIIGLSIAAPVGPIGVLCIRRTLADGRAIGFASGLGAATADAVYGAVAAFGLSLVTNALVEQRVWLQAGGGVFLCYLGVRTWRAVPHVASGGPADGRGLAAAWASTFALTLTNPTTIISFAAIQSTQSLLWALVDAAIGIALVLVFFKAYDWIDPRDFEQELAAGNNMLGMELEGLFVIFAGVIVGAMNLLGA